MKADELYATITNRVIAALETGTTGEWKMPWHAVGTQMTPLSATGRAYRGINELWLAMVAMDRNWMSGRWGTYKAWQGVGGQVRKGEKSTAVFLWKPVERKVEGSDDTKRGLIAVTYNVFAAEQCDGPIPEAFVAGASAVADVVARDEAWVALWQRIGADIEHGGNRACFIPSRNVIRIPMLAQFTSEEAYNSTLAHEHIHWTGPQLGRDLHHRFGSEAYAAEELVAEIGAAFMCGRMSGVAQPRDDHSEYVASWLRVLKQDSKAIVSVASKAQQATDLLCKLGGIGEREEANGDGDGCVEGRPDRNGCAVGSAAA